MMSGANISGALVQGTNFYNTGITSAQLYSTSSYQSGNLSGLNLGGNDLTGWNLAGQLLQSANLSYANLTGANLSAAGLMQANLSSATLTAANLANANLSNVTLTYADLRETDATRANFSTANLTGADLSRANLTNAIFTSAVLTGANLGGADTRGAQSLSTFSLNTIRTDGQIAGLDLGADRTLIVRDYDGDASRGVAPIAIRINTSFVMGQDGLLKFVLEEDAWNSTISFTSGIPVTLDGNLELTFAPNVNVANQYGRTFTLFNWVGVMPSGSFQVQSPYSWNLTNLYTTGQVTLLSPSLPGDFNGDGTVDTADYVWLVAKNLTH